MWRAARRKVASALAPSGAAEPAVSAQARPWRVLHVMASGAHGGGADHLLGLLPALAALGLSVHAAVGDDGPLAERLQAKGIDCMRLQMMGRAPHLGRLAQARACLDGPFDVVHWHGTRAAFYGSLAAWGLSGAVGAGAGAQAGWRRPCLVYTAHGLAFRQQAPWPARMGRAAAEAMICRAADATISVCRADLAVLRAAGCLWQRTSAHIGNAVDGSRFVPAAAKQARAASGLVEDAWWVGTVARLVPQKNVAALMDALVPLPPRVRLAVVGDGPQRRALAQHPLARLGRVRFLGCLDDVAAVLPAFDVFALASAWEGEPIALLEAMACGLACVATDTPGAIEVLCPPRHGLCVARGSAPAMTHALHLLLHDAPLRRALGTAAQTAVAARTYAAQADRVVAVYGALRHGHASRRRRAA